MQSFAVLDVCALEVVFGGQNTTGGNVNVGVTVPTKGGPVQVGVQGGYQRTRTNYAECLANYRAMGGNVDGLRAACGLPSGQP